MLYKNKIVNFCFFSLFFILLVGCNKKQINNENQSKPHCLSSQNHCTITIENKRFPVLFNVNEVIPEQLFSIIIPSLSALQPTNTVIENLQGIDENKVEIIAISGYLEGINMYMGKIPLFFNSRAENFIADVMVGSCSEENMKWRLLFTIKYELNNELFEISRTIEI